MLKSPKALVFIDNHDNQRGHGGGGSDILTFRTSTLYKMATAYMLAWPYGVTQIMSSYGWDQNIVNGKDTNDWVYYLIQCCHFPPKSLFTVWLVLMGKMI